MAYSSQFWGKPGEVGLLLGSTARGLAGAFNYISQGPLGRIIEQGSNESIPNLLPSPQDLLSLYYRNAITPAQTQTALKFHGISLQPEFGNQNFHYYWQKFIDFNQPWPTVTEILEMFYRGYINDAQLQTYLQRAGIPTGLWNDYITQLSTPLDAEMIKYYHHLGSFGGADVTARMKILGYQNEDDIQKIIYRSLPVDPGGIIMLRNREFTDDAEFTKDLVRSGYVEATDVAKWNELRKQIPSPSDLISFAIKEGWDAGTVAKFQYDAEFPPEFQLWMERQGFGWDSLGVDAAGNPIPGPPWPKLYWRTHWRNISPSQAYELLHRCRGDKLNPATWRIPGVMPFDASDVAEVLKVNDYPVPFRDRLAAVSYRIPTRVDVRRMIIEGIITDAQAIDYYQDMGYTVTDATLLVKFVHSADATSKLKAARQGARQAIRDSYSIGLIDANTAMVQLKRLLSNSAAEIASFDLLPPAIQLLNATADPLVTAEIQVIDIDQTKALVKVAVAGIRRAYLHNEINAIIAQTELISIGIQLPRITQYIKMWDAQRWSQGKDVTVARILKWVCKGKITVAAGQTRLIALGYSTIDAAIMITEALDCAAADVAKLKKETAKIAKDKADAIAKVIKAAADAIKTAQAVLAKHGSPAQLKKWYHEGLISELEATTRLGILGYPLVDAQRWLADPAALPPGSKASLESGIPVLSVPG